MRGARARALTQKQVPMTRAANKKCLHDCFRRFIAVTLTGNATLMRKGDTVVKGIVSEPYGRTRLCAVIFCLVSLHACIDESKQE